MKLWWVLRSYGTDGLRAILRDHLEWASWLSDRVERDDRLALVAPTWTGLVTLAHADGDGATRALAAALVAERDLAATATTLEAPHLPDGGIAALRLSIGSMLTTRADVEDLWARLDRLA